MFRRSNHSRARRTDKGFTLVEVMVAASVMLLAISSALFVIQQGLQAIDTARAYTSASQLMQDEMERLRLKSWAQIEELQNSGTTFTVASSRVGPGQRSVTCKGSIRNLVTDMKEITLVSTWNGYNGQPHEVRLVTYYAKTGMYDYLYTTH